MTNAVDQAIHDWIVDHRTALLTSMAWKVSSLGSTPFVATGVIMVGIVLSVRKRSWIPLVACICADLAVELSARGIKLLVGRPRPPYDEALEHFANSSFPAGHVARAALLFALIAMVVPARHRTAAIGASAVIVCAVAWSRVYLGSHWFTDTLAAWPFGVAAVWALWMLDVVPRGAAARVEPVASE